MAGNTLNASSTMQCPHGGQVQISTGNTSSKADGPAMILATDTYSISGCPFHLPGTPPIPSPCVQVVWIVPDMRVRVNGTPTLSQGSTGLCLAGTGIPQGPVNVVNTQSRGSSQ